jgi:hypothetical protein
MPRRSLIALALLATTAFAACSSSPSASGAPSAPLASQPASMEPVASSDPGTGPSSRDWCLNTPEEVSAAIGGAAVTATSSDVPGVGGACNYALADGRLVYAVAVVQSEGAVSTFQAAKSTQGVVTVSGIGDDALLMSPQGPLAILKGTSFISLGTLPDSGITEADWRAKNEALGKAAAGRL